jgi:hypothetical protein
MVKFGKVVILRAVVLEMGSDSGQGLNGREIAVIDFPRDAIWQKG